MLQNSLYILTLVSALGAGLMAGLFFVFSGAVMKALGSLPPAQGVAAMQAINRTIINPVFLTVFLGTAACGVAAAIVQLMLPGSPAWPWVYTGAALYLLCGIVITAAVNVPMNNALKPESQEGNALWTRYLVRWTAWNHGRALGCLAASAAFAAAWRE